MIDKLKQQFPGYVFHLVNDKENYMRTVMITSHDGTSFGAVYWYDDNDDTAYLSNLSTSEGFRNEGKTKKMMNVMETVARETTAERFMLQVMEDSWTRYWYENIGYAPYTSRDEDGFIWMVKKNKTC